MTDVSGLKEDIVCIYINNLNILLTIMKSMYLCFRT